MTPLDSGLAPVWNNAAFWIGFVFSLLVLSFVIRDSWLVRAAQYLLVGVTLAYTVILVWSNVLWPRLFTQLLTTALSIVDNSGAPNPALWNSWLPLAAGLILWVAGINHLWMRRKAGRASWLRNLAALPLALLLGVGLGAGIAGALQGTLLPQFRSAATLSQPPEAPPSLPLAGLLTLIITGGALLHLRVGASGERTHFPMPLRLLLAGWAWLGERALWLTAGVIFAHLFASRITLLIARLDMLFFGPQLAELWRRLMTLWPGS